MQTNLKLEEHIRWTRDRFSYVILRAPNFPPEDGTTTIEQFAELRHGIEEILRRTRKSDRRQWLELTLAELERSLAAYESGDRDKGLDILYSAEEHYKNAIHGKKYESPSGNDATTSTAPPTADDVGGAGGPEEAVFEQEVRYEAQQQAESGERFRQWLKEHPESPWHGVLPPEPEPERPTFFGRLFGRLMGRKTN